MNLTEVWSPDHMDDVEMHKGQLKRQDIHVPNRPNMAFSGGGGGGQIEYWGTPSESWGNSLAPVASQGPLAGERNIITNERRIWNTLIARPHHGAGFSEGRANHAGRIQNYSCCSGICGWGTFRLLPVGRKVKMTRFFSEVTVVILGFGTIAQESLRRDFVNPAESCDSSCYKKYSSVSRNCSGGKK